MRNCSIYKSHEKVFSLHLSIENLIGYVYDLEQVEYALLGVKRGLDHLFLLDLDELESLLIILVSWVRNLDFKNLVF